MFKLFKVWPFFRRGNALTNTVSVVGIGNKTINIVAADGAACGYRPHIRWNTAPQAGGGDAVWLEWRTKVTSLIGRAAEKQALIDWANAPGALSFKVVKAPGGVGKTRLAAEVAQALVDTGHWDGGFVGLNDFERAQRLAWQGHWMLVVDYPEHAPQQLTKLVRAAKEGLRDGAQDKLRILLLCRAQEGIDALLAQHGAKSYLSAPLALGELSETDNLNLLNQSLHKLAPTQAPVSPSEFKSWVAQSPLHRTALFVVALALHLAHAPAAPDRFLPAAQLLEALLQREQSRWHKAEEGQGLSHGTLADVVAFATLLGGLSVADVNTHLAKHLSWAEPGLQKVHAALADVWPLDGAKHAYPAMAPDLLAAAFLWHWHGQACKQGLMHDAQLLAALACQQQAASVTLLQRWNMQAYDQTVRLQLGKPQESSSLENLLLAAAPPGADFANTLKRAFVSGNKWSGLSSLSVCMSRPSRSVSSVDVASTDALRARELNSHAIDLAEAGERPAALTAALEAVDLYKRLAKTNPVAYEPSLAGSLNNLAICLSENGDRPAALTVALEAVDLYKYLAETNTAAYEPVLAMSLNNLANRLSESGLLQSALTAALDAVDLYKRLVQTNPATYEPDVAMILSTLAKCLSENGDRPAALTAAKEAADLYKRLAQSNPATYEPDWAGSLNSLTKHLSESGDRAAALAAAKEAVDLYKRLAKTNPAAYEPVLAGSLNNLANCLSQNGDRPAALTAAQDAVDIRKRLVQSNPAAYEPDLAASLNNLAAFLSENGDPPAARAAAQEAVSIRKRLAQSNPAAYEPVLAGSLNNLANRLSENGDRPAALAAAQEAVDLYKRLAQSNPAAYEPVLAVSLNNLANRLSENGHLPAALVAAQEAVDLYQRLAQSNPSAYEPDLAGSLNNLAASLIENGDRPAALAVAQEAVALYEKASQQTPGAFDRQLAIAMRVRDGLR